MAICLKQFEVYIDELESQLYEWDDGPISWQCELKTLQDTIKILMNRTYKSKDTTEKIVLATLEYRARRCRDCILRRNLMYN
jgi:hypothetical protein